MLQLDSRVLKLSWLVLYYILLWRICNYVYTKGACGSWLTSCAVIGLVHFSMQTD